MAEFVEFMDRSTCPFMLQRNTIKFGLVLDYEREEWSSQ